MTTGNDVTTKKKPEPPALAEKPRVERGRYARLLADGCVVVVERSSKARKAPPLPQPGPATSSD